jgi:hypothetical protein
MPCGVTTRRRAWAGIHLGLEYAGFKTAFDSIEEARLGWDSSRS